MRKDYIKPIFRFNIMATSIASLPNELSINTQDDNIKMEIKEKNETQNQIVQQFHSQREKERDQDLRENSQHASNQVSNQSVADLISGLKSASKTGSTMLQSRDIPMSLNQITQDSEAKPNYVPTAKHDKSNYIQDEETMETLIRHKKLQHKNKMDNFYDEIQTPLLIMIMFFIFQLPVFKKSMITNFPAFFKRSGNYNLKGLVFVTILFGGFYYSIIKSIKYLSEL